MTATTHLLGSQSILNRLTAQQRTQAAQRRVFKFFHAEAEAAILSRGSIRIGTVQSFRATENESLRTRPAGFPSAPTLDIRAGQAIDRLVHPTSPFYPWILQTVGAVATSDLRVFGADRPLGFDLYAYSFSYACNETVLGAMAGETPYDRVAVIKDVFALAKLLIDLHPALRNAYYLIYPAIAMDRYRLPQEAHPHPFEQAFEKHAHFAGDAEGRIVFVNFNPVRLYSQVPPLADFAHPNIQRWFQPGTIPVEKI